MEDNYGDIINEKIIHDSPPNVIKGLYNVCKSICKIEASNIIGSGFLIKLSKGNSPLFCLMTNEHVITKDMIESKIKIKIFYDNKYKSVEIVLDKKKRFIKDYLYLGIDAIIIEIIKEDEIKDDYFLLPNMEYKNGYKEFENKEIYIPQYPGGNELSNSKGTIKSINNYEFSHFASTERGSSGSPIIIEGTIKVIGIHKQGRRDKSENYGDFIGPIVESLKKNLKYDKKYYNKGIYEGEYENGKFEGNGKFIYQNGNYYIGQWHDGERYGKGILYYKKGNIKYNGDFLYGKYEGNGKYIYENGEYYIGQWLDGNRHGKGILYYKNKNIKYDGDFLLDKFEGNGKYIYEDDEYYIGQFSEGKKHGKGILYYRDGNIKYEGDFVSDKYEGNGKYIYENGEYYIGQWANGNRHGKGILFYKNDNIKYEGNFAFDRYKEEEILYISY